MIPSELLKEIADLQKVGYQIETSLVGSRVYVVFKDYILPSSFNMEKTDLLVWTNTNYPSCAFDMFWVHEKLFLSNGVVPQAAQHIENHCGINWRRFSIHPYQVKPWNPSEDSLEGYISYINKRLNQGI
ncbi:E2/UBC family protein [Polaribacter huanghezhanensis]|uniref:E2/UBC family protein n=1 Tax=Polaribacter huanghezhanensis TaxID=1354726 RepID=UPI0026481B67|nr:E2/UBC family protein [Polaribacter huanghezhanensis]